MVDLKRLRLLRELARRGTMTAVGEALGFSASAVSQQLAILEREVRQKLWEQVGRGVRLTPEGERLARRAEGVFEAADALEDALRHGGEAPGGRIEVASFPSFAKARLLPALVEARRRAPDLRPILHELEPEAALQALVAGRCDLAITYAYSIVPRPRPGGLVASPVLDEPMVVVLPREAFGDGPDPLPLSSLAEAEWIVGSYQADDHVLLERACSLAGFAPRISHRVDDYGLVLQLAAAGLGVGFVPELALREGLPNGAVVRRPLEVALQRRIEAVARPGLSRSPAIRLFLDLLAGV